MIDRYAREAMKAIWTDHGKYDRWLKVEIAACEAWAQYGTIPLDDMTGIREATWDPALLADKFQETRHDMTAFLYSVTANLGPEGRWIHLGMTSNDVWDTATALQLKDSSNLLLNGIDRAVTALETQAKQHKHIEGAGAKIR